jgi:hypothetical protein
MSNELEGAQPWYSSKGIWGSLITIISGILAWITGHDIPADQQTILSNQLYVMIGAGAQIATVVGGLLSWYGRTTATKKIDTSALPIFRKD